MPTLTDRLLTIESLRHTIEAHGKLPDEVLRRIEYKFRLECNYNSNKIEGGTLTKPETRSVMTGNITVAGKPLKDIREMKGHDEAMKDIFRMGNSEKRLSEKRIQAVHKQIIVAETPEQEQAIGKWKTRGNHIINYRGEKFDFTPPNVVPEAIHDLLNWLNAGLDKIRSQDKNAPNPILLALEFHLRYLTIHPFLDGNGRTARLLTNLVLVSLGYPPFWVAEGGEKDVYNRYLADVQAYGGSPDLLYEFLAGLLERSLQITLDAIEGREIEDLDDWKKELTLLKNRLPEKDGLSAMRSQETVTGVYNQSIKPALIRVVQELTEYDDLFLKKEVWIGTDHLSTLYQMESDLDNPVEFNDITQSIHFNYNLEGFKKAQEKQFHIKCRLIWNFDNYAYSLQIEGAKEALQFKKKYDEFYGKSEIDEIVKQCGSIMLQQ
ncbi:MAG: Fic family protein [Saprospirales bacterium]|nr:Fic family protein [Saprospirales bacterium]